MKQPVALIVMDGWGLASPGPGNAITQAKLTYLPRYWVSYPHTELSASGESVGLPNNEDGNTETGHLNLGAGRVVYQDLPRITMSIADGSFYRNEALVGAVRYAVTHRSNLHIMGVISDAGVHGSRDHLYAILQLVRQQAPQCPTYIHLFTDGRDSSPKAGLSFVTDVEAKCTLYGIGTIATVMGRYYAMDRDRRWERTQQAYIALTEQTLKTARNVREAVQASYDAGITDEFIEPTQIVNESGIPYPRIANNDAVIFYNYRIDRPRQLTRAFVLPNFETHNEIGSFDPYAIKYAHKHTVTVDTTRIPFTRKVILPNIFFVTMTEYEKNLPCIIAFPTEIVKMTLGRVLYGQGLRQLRVSESEKERFVTYYFNGLREDPFPGEDHLIVPSPNVATYDLMPQMSVLETTGKLLDRLALDIYSFFLINIANPDMVGHTGNIKAAITACEITDRCVGRIVDSVLAVGGSCFITADHGNVEEMLASDGSTDTEHSINPVPFMIISKQYANYPHMLPKGKLGDVAPTILAHKNIPIPSDMSGNNLLSGLQALVR